VRLSPRRKIFYACSAIFSIMLLVLGRDRLTVFLGDEPGKKIPASVLASELDRLPLPPGYSWQTSPDVFDKEVITGASANLTGTVISKSLLDYYQQILPTKGWDLMSDENVSKKNRLRFCKSGISLTIEKVSSTHGAHYYVGAVWTKFHNSQDYCTPEIPLDHIR
jgi:hypothetical protein